MTTRTTLHYKDNRKKSKPKKSDVEKSGRFFMRKFAPWTPDGGVIIVIIIVAEPARRSSKRKKNTNPSEETCNRRIHSCVHSSILFNSHEPFEWYAIRICVEWREYCCRRRHLPNRNYILFFSILRSKVPFLLYTCIVYHLISLLC